MTLLEKFKSSNSNVLSMYVTAGFPALESLPVLIRALSETGVDLIEIGIPYSDPSCDGPVIQNSNQVAISNGITLDIIFTQLKHTPTALPKIMMGYFNTFLQYGIEGFCKRCSEVGVSGVIIPDLPVEIYVERYQRLFEKYGLSNVFMITPETSDERIFFIDKCSSSFIYAVSNSGITGKMQGIAGTENYLTRLSELNLNHPILLGFNIREKSDIELATRYVQGAIIGSAFINRIASSANIVKETKEFVNEILHKETT